MSSPASPHTLKAEDHAWPEERYPRVAAMGILSLSGQVPDSPPGSFGNNSNCKSNEVQRCGRATTYIRCASQVHLGQSLNRTCFPGTPGPEAKQNVLSRYTWARS